MRERTRGIVARGRRLGERAAPWLRLTRFRRRRRPWLGPTLIAAAILLVAWLAGRWANGYVKPSTPEERTNLLQAVAQIAGGAILLLGLYFTARTYQVNREGQITERFTRAIDQLGSPSLDVRLGAIYALERIAHDSDTHYWSVMEVLTAYLRERAPWPNPVGQLAFDAAQVIQRGQRDRGHDLQAIVSVLGRRRRRYGRGEDLHIDLGNCDLSWLSLVRGHFEGAIFVGSNFYQAGMMESRLDGAFLMNAHLHGALLDHARLVGCNLYGANFGPLTTAYNTDFTGAIMDGDTDLGFARLEHAVGLTWEQVRRAKRDEQTRLPPDIQALADAHDTKAEGGGASSPAAPS